MKLLTVALLVLAGTVWADIEFDVDVEQHMDKLVRQRYPIEDNKENRESVRNYIIERMRYYGLDVKEQRFNTTINTDPRGIGSEQIQVQGTNVIGINKAVTQHPGAVVVVGADYDSDGTSDPMFYNGAGVAALLEVARLYAFNEGWSGRLVANYTTIFVAFDINTKLYESSPGYPGGHFFVKEWLWPFIQRNPDYFGGAVILDSVLNVNYEERSQFLDADFGTMFPESYERIEGGNFKGDFLAMVSSGNSEATETLKDQFSGNYYKGRKGERFRLEDLQLRTGMNFDDMVKRFVKSENIHFWSFKDDTNTTVPLPAILLTDTGSFRNLPPNCDTCHPMDMLTEERTEFVEATIKATTNFLFKRQATLLPETDSAVSSLPSAIMTALMLCLVRLYM